ncbi:MAG: PEP-CTERM sorting domain-containing protein [Cognaticolwellia aestuarii]
MKNLIKTYHVKTLALAIALSCTTAHAGIIVGFGGQSATDGSGLTSNLVNANNIQDTSTGVFIETFDIATAMTDLGGLITGGFGSADTSYNYNDFDTDADAAGCGVNTTGATGINITTTGGGFGVTIGNQPGVAANPGNGNTSIPSIEDNTCYGFTPASGPSGTVTIDYSAFLAGLGVGVLIDYFGFYWGSVDEYNDFTFFDSTTNTSETLLGSDLLAAQVVSYVGR